MKRKHYATKSDMLKSEPCGGLRNVNVLLSASAVMKREKCEKVVKKVFIHSHPCNKENVTPRLRHVERQIPAARAQRD